MEANETDEVGIVRGLAWTSVGGDTLQIEVNVMPGKGDVQADRTARRCDEGVGAGGDQLYPFHQSRSTGSTGSIFQEHDIHIHIPEGAVPKDGPSAGITMATAMFSAITGKPVRADVAMTGEITLRGRVLPIGGLKEKTPGGKKCGDHDGMRAEEE